MTTETQTKRCPSGGAVNIGVAPPRVRYHLNDLGLNSDVKPAALELGTCKTLDELSESSNTVVTNVVAAHTAELQRCVDNCRTKLDSCKERLAADKCKADDVKAATAALKSANDNLKTWTGGDAKTNATRALQNAKYRISSRAVIALASALDKLVHEFGLHAVKNTIAANRTNISEEHFFTGVEDLPLYPLVSTLESFQQFKTRMMAPPAPKAEKPEEKDADNANNPIVVDNVPRGHNNFGYYVHNIVQQHIPSVERVKDGKTVQTRAVRVTKEFKNLMSTFLSDFISNRMTCFLRVLLEVRDAKTVTEEHICCALRLMMQDAHCDPTELLKYVSERIDRWNKYEQDHVVVEYNEEVVLAELKPVEPAEEAPPSPKKKAKADKPAKAPKTKVEKPAKAPKADKPKVATRPRKPAAK